MQKKLCTLGGIRTPNPRFRRPMPYPLGHEGEGTENGQFHKIWLQYKRKVHFFPISIKKLLFSTFRQSFRRNFNFLKFDDNEESLRSRYV